MLNYAYTTLNWGPHASSAQVSLRRPRTPQVSLYLPRWTPFLTQYGLQPESIEK